jgi:hypothetical protein
MALFESHVNPIDLFVIVIIPTWDLQSDRKHILFLLSFTSSGVEHFPIPEYPNIRTIIEEP